MRRNMGFTVIELILVVVLMAVAAAILFPAFARSSRSPRKAACISNLRQIALACIMYAGDYDEVLPACVADDIDGTAHAVGGVYTNWKIPAMERDIKAKYGDEYFDGRWMWQLADVLGYYPYLKSLDIFSCPTLTRQDPYFGVQTYVVGTDKRTGARDPHDPLRPHMPGAGILPGGRKTWQSGSYAYMCMHFPRGRSLRASDYGSDLMSFWDVANLLGLVGQPGTGLSASPGNHLCCGNDYDSFADSLWEPLLMCRSFGVHEGYSPDYVNRHVLPRELGGATPTILAATPVAFADGHVKYMRMSFYGFLALTISPNK